jgi:predicted nucleic acid-binding protein
MTQVIIDTGPLVAYFNRSDRHHRWAMAQMAALAPPLLTCEPVLAEASYLIQRAGGKPWDLIRKVSQGILRIRLNLEADASAVQSLMERYADTPMSLADACLVRLTEIVTDCKLFTLDSDFAHYRRNGRHAIPLLIP